VAIGGGVEDAVLLPPPQATKIEEVAKSEDRINKFLK